MHYHCEVVMPPTPDVEGSLSKVLGQFDENNPENSHSFWDWWVIGGRYAGDKLAQTFDQEKMKHFRKWLTDQKFTVSGLIWGKEELNPPDQRKIVDAKWQEMFGVNGPCPIFKHSNPDNEAIAGDIMPLDKAIRTKCYRVIFASPFREELGIYIDDSLGH